MIPRGRTSVAIVAVLLSLLPGLGFCAGWPAYRADAARTGATEERLTFPLRLAWKYVPPRPPAPAWPEAANNPWDISRLYGPGRIGESDVQFWGQRATYARSLNPDPDWGGADWQAERVDFDYAPQPVVAGELACFGSTTDDTVRAIDLSSGKLAWRFTTGGPIRFAPAIARGKAYVASDDGWLYCLNAANGELVWKSRAALADDQILGNGRMISRWPLRSGVLVSDGVAYVTAGMWPAEGVFVYALDAETGRILWCNDTGNAMWMAQPHGGSYAMTGVVPQGYLLASEDLLLVPTGRSVPAAYERSTGRLLYYRQSAQRAGGSTWACIDEARGWFFNRNVGWPLMGAYSLASGEWTRKQWSVDELVVGPDGEYTADSNSVRGEGLQASHPGSTYSLALAGRTLLAGGADSITAYDVPENKQVWQAEVEGETRGIAAANGRLVVSTSEGIIYCFKPGRESGKHPVQIASPTENTSTDTVSPAVQRVLAIVAERGLTKGYALVVGSANARLGQEIAAHTSLHVITVLKDEAKVAAERQRLLSETDLYGARIAVQYLANPSDLPYAPYFANLVVICEEPEGLSGEELYRVLRPCGGIMCFVGAGRATQAQLLKEADVPQDEIESRQDTQVVVRGKLPGALDWDSEVTCDQRVKWPLELLWHGGPGPARMTDRHWGAPLPVAAEGRYFVIGEHDVMAVDAYNGCELWSRPVANAFSRPLRLLTALAADDQSVYLTFGHITYQLDAQTGEQLKVYGDFAAPERHSLEKPHGFDFELDEQHRAAIAFKNSSDGLLVALKTVDPVLTRWDGWELFFDFRPPSRRTELYGPGVFHLLVETKSGKCRPGIGPVHPHVRVTQSESGDGSDIALLIPWEEIVKIIGDKPADFGFAAVLTSDDGRGRRKTNLLGSRYAYVFNDGWPTFVLDSGEATPPAGGSAVPVVPWSELPAVARQTGGRLPSRPGAEDSAGWRGFWQKQLAGPLPGRARDETPLYDPSRVQPFTGEEQPKSYRKAYGCAGIITSATMDFFRSGTLGFFDFEDDSGLRNFGGMKPGCGFSGGLLPALGLLISNEASSGCTCSYNLQCSLALAPAAERSNEDWAVHYSEARPGASLEGTALNLGAPGDRRDGRGALWLGIPRPWTGEAGRREGLSLTVPLHTEGYRGGGAYRVNADRVPIEGTERPWIYASGYRGLKSAVLDLSFYEPVLGVPSFQCERAPGIDGLLDDACWDGSGRVCFPLQEQYVYCWEPDPPEPSGHPGTRVYMRHDEQNLYVAGVRTARVNERGRALPWKAQTQGQDAPVWQDDSFEMYITGNGVPKFVHLGLSPSGARYDGLWSAVCEIPLLDDIVLDGEGSDWAEKGFHISMFGKGECRIGWTDRGLLLLGEFEDGFFPGDRRYPDVVFVAVDLATGDSLQLAVRPGEGMSVMEHYADQSVEKAHVQPATGRTDGAYVVEALFPWATLNLGPATRKEIGFAVACASRDSRWFARGMRGVARDFNHMARLRLADRAGAPAALTGPGAPALLRVEEDAGWNGTWSGAVKMDGDTVTAEMAIPWTTLAAVGLDRDALTVKFDESGKVTPSMIEAKAHAGYLLPVHPMVPRATANPYTVRLHFAEPDDAAPGQRVFDVKLQGRTVLEHLDVVKEAGGRFRALVKEFKGVEAENVLTVELVPRADDLTPSTAPVLSGLEVMLEREGE